MSFYKYFLPIITFISLHTKPTISIGNQLLLVQKTGVEKVYPDTVGLVMTTEVNNTSNEYDFEVHVTSDECCIENDSKEDCNVIKIIGDTIETIQKGTMKELKFVAPLLDQFERKGYCIFYLDSKPKDRQGETMRDTIKIQFDTRLENNNQVMIVPTTITVCNGSDEDPLNGCKPVDCETYYNGRKSYFDKKTKRCTNVPSCISDNIDEEVPNVTYDSTTNKCRSGKAITKNDLNLIKSLTNEKPRIPKDILILKKMKSPKNVANKNDLLNLNKDKSKEKEPCLKLLIAKYIRVNKFSIMVFGGIIFVQCCLICSMIYCITEKCKNCKKKTVVRKFFNDRQDATASTPLICTSTVDTDTTEFQYTSESSNIDQKIKCYKACQRERYNNVKMSMSDDILSKCITRRDWSSKPAACDVIPEIQRQDDTQIKGILQSKDNSNEEFKDIYQANVNSHPKKVTEAKVNFENEKSISKTDKKQNKHANSGINQSTNLDRKGMSYDEMLCDLSEKEIKCHTYNLDGNSNIAGSKPSLHRKFSILKTDRTKKGNTISTEKEAQASFSNDSIDDILSERGLIFLASEYPSKYSFSSSIGKNSASSSAVSSKTSKNSNLFKNVRSLLHRKVKQSSASDPGTKKTSNIDMEVLHMSHASAYSSNDSDYLRSLKVTQESRSSL